MIDVETRTAASEGGRSARPGGMPGLLCVLTRAGRLVRATMIAGANGQQMASKLARCTALVHRQTGYCPSERLIMAHSEGSRRYIVAIS